MTKTRPTAVAGSFYPGSRSQAVSMLDKFFSNVASNVNFTAFKEKVKHSKAKIHGIIVPHAGWVYSGEVAAYAYDLIKDKGFTKFILLGPNHTAYVDKAYVDDSDYWQTPLGKVSVSKDKISNPYFLYSSAPHVQEHDLEVQIPFLQYIFAKQAHGHQSSQSHQLTEANFTIMPIIVGELKIDAFDSVVKALTSIYDDKTLFIISTDLSHYMPIDEAQKTDTHTIKIIQNLAFEKAGQMDACGKVPLLIAMLLCKAFGTSPIPLKYATSGEASGEYNSVVGYVSMMF
jgi:predicted class III extradiol MEMO1 family dioxygenase